MRWNAPAMLAAALAFSGCAGARVADGDGAQLWPKTLQVGEGAVLFGAAVAPPSQELPEFTGYAALFREADESPDGGKARVRLSDKTGKPLDNLFLIALPAGTYAYSQLEAVGPNGLNPDLAIPGESFMSFTVRPGEVTVLGTVSASIQVRRQFGDLDWDRRVEAASDSKTKLRLLDAALVRFPEGEWNKRFNDAKAGIR